MHGNSHKTFPIYNAEYANAIMLGIIFRSHQLEARSALHVQLLWDLCMECEQKWEWFEISTLFLRQGKYIGWDYCARNVRIRKWTDGFRLHEADPWSSIIFCIYDILLWLFPDEHWVKPVIRLRCGCLAANCQRTSCLSDISSRDDPDA